MKKNQKYNYVSINSLKDLSFNKDGYDSVDSVLRRTICKMSDAENLYKNNIFITLDKNSQVKYYYYVYKYFSKYEDDLVELYENKKMCITYTYKDIIHENNLYKYSKIYPAYLLIDIVKYIGETLNIKYNIVLSPLNKDKCVVYISNLEETKIFSFLRNKNTNEWDLNDYANIAITLYEYFLKYFKSTFKK